jgi:hypothetical protein
MEDSEGEDGGKCGHCDQARIETTPKLAGFTSISTNAETITIERCELSCCLRLTSFSLIGIRDSAHVTLLCALH